MAMQDIPTAHPKIELDLKDYGMKGKIILSQPDFKRITAMQNTILRIVWVNEHKGINEMTEQERQNVLNEASTKYASTFQNCALLAYIESAPFHLNDYREEVTLDMDSFYDFMTAEIYVRLNEEVRNLGMINPLS